MQMADPLLPDEQGRPQIFENGVIGNPELFEKHQRFNLGANYEGLNDHRLSLWGRLLHW